MSDDDLTPVDGDPYAITLTPVDGDPFENVSTKKESPSSYGAAGSADDIAAIRAMMAKGSSLPPGVQHYIMSHPAYQEWQPQDSGTLSDSANNAVPPGPRMPSTTPDDVMKVLRDNAWVRAHVNALEGGDDI